MNAADSRTPNIPHALAHEANAAFRLFCQDRTVPQGRFHAFVMAACGYCFVSAAAAASVGGPELPNVHTLYVGLLAKIPLPIGANRD